MSREELFRINHHIRARQVLVIDDAEVKLGVMPTDKAVRAAKERGLDLVEVSPGGNPPVCRMMDFGKFKYEQKKKNRGTKKSHQGQLKEIRLRPMTDKHDIATKVKHAREFLAEGNKVQITIVYRGREMAHQEIGREVAEFIKKLLEDAGKIEREPHMEGHRLHMTFRPLGKGETHAKAKDPQSGGKAVQSNRPPQSPVPPVGQPAPVVEQNSQTPPQAGPVGTA